MLRHTYALRPAARPTPTTQGLQRPARRLGRVAVRASGAGNESRGEGAVESGGQPTLKGLESHSKKWLQGELARKGLPVSGTKAELTARLLHGEGQCGLQEADAGRQEESTRHICPVAEDESAFWNSKTVRELRRELAAVGLPTTGRKETLVHRLAKYGEVAQGDGEGEPLQHEKDSTFASETAASDSSTADNAPQSIAHLSALEPAITSAAEAEAKSLQAKTVAELQKELVALALPKTGRKELLVQRLVKFKHGAGACPPTPGGGANRPPSAAAGIQAAAPKGDSTIAGTAVPGAEVSGPSSASAESQRTAAAPADMTSVAPGTGSLMSMTVTELRKKLVERGLPRSGKKAILVQRLVKHAAGGQTLATPTAGRAAEQRAPESLQDLTGGSNAAATTEGGHVAGTGNDKGEGDEESHGGAVPPPLSLLQMGSPGEGEAADPSEGDTVASDVLPEGKEAAGLNDDLEALAEQIKQRESALEDLEAKIAESRSSRQADRELLESMERSLQEMKKQREDWFRTAGVENAEQIQSLVKELEEKRRPAQDAKLAELRDVLSRLEEETLAREESVRNLAESLERSLGLPASDKQETETPTDRITINGIDFPVWGEDSATGQEPVSGTKEAGIRPAEEETPTSASLPEARSSNPESKLDKEPAGRTDHQSGDAGARSSSSTKAAGGSADSNGRGGPGDIGKGLIGLFGAMTKVVGTLQQAISRGAEKGGRD